MRSLTPALRSSGLYLVFLAAFVVPASPSRGQSIPEREAIIDQLSRFDTAPELDIAALRQRVLDKSRARSRNEPEPSGRPPVAPELLKLPTFNLDIHFDPDTPVVRPDSYQTLGRTADALVNATLLPYIRDVLVNTFKISSKRLQSLGLGEEQFIDSAHPTSPTNLQIQILTIARQTEQSEQAQRATAPPATPAKKPARKR